MKDEALLGSGGRRRTGVAPVSNSACASFLGRTLSVVTVFIRLVGKRSQTQRCKAHRDTQRRLLLATSATFPLLAHRIVAHREDFLDCGGKRSATPLLDRQQSCQSGVALRFPPQSKTFGLRLRRAMPLRLVCLSTNRKSAVVTSFLLAKRGNEVRDRRDACPTPTATSERSFILQPSTFILSP